MQNRLERVKSGWEWRDQYKEILGKYKQKNKVGMAVLILGKVELTIKNTKQDKEDQ